MPFFPHRLSTPLLTATLAALAAFTPACSSKTASGDGAGPTGSPAPASRPASREVDMKHGAEGCDGMAITHVSATPEKTVLQLSWSGCKAATDNDACAFPPGTKDAYYLAEPDGTRRKLTEVTGIALCEKYSRGSPTSPVVWSMTFEPLAPETAQFDLIEGALSQGQSGDGFHFKGVKLK